MNPSCSAAASAGSNPRAQRRLASAANQLHELHDELDLADAAGAELQIVGEILARDFGIDQRLHLAKARERRIIEIAPEHERPQRIEKPRAADAIAADRARLDPGVALPVPSFALVVLLHRREREHRPAGMAKRPKTQIDAIDVAVGVALGDQRDERLRDARVIRLGVERPRAVARAVFGEREDEIDVGREIELAAAEFAEAENDHALRTAARIADDAVTRGDLALGARERGLDAGLGEHGRAGERRLDRVEIVEIAPDQPDRLALPEKAQLRRELDLTRRGREHAGARVRVAGIAHEAQKIGAEQRGIAKKALVGEIAREQHALEMIVDAGVVVERHARIAAGGLEAREPLVEEGRDRARQERFRRRQHGSILAAAPRPRPARNPRQQRSVA
jgi:hypothetical protein